MLARMIYNAIASLLLLLLHTAQPIRLIFFKYKYLPLLSFLTIVDVTHVENYFTALAVVTETYYISVKRELVKRYFTVKLTVRGGVNSPLGPDH